MGTEAANKAFSAYVGLDEPKAEKKSKAKAEVEPEPEYVPEPEAAPTE